LAKPLPPPPLPKPKPKGKKGSAFAQYVNAHPKIKPYAALISKWAQRYGLDPIYYAALILFESGGNPNARSSANAVGLVQIHLPSHPNVTEAQAKNPAFAIRWGAQFFGAQLRKHGTYEAAYRKGYNPG
jgi:soluble lytic murein transglycosylase-like protein